VAELIFRWPGATYKSYPSLLYAEAAWAAHQQRIVRAHEWAARAEQVAHAHGN
jgi:hypothetical protein